MTDFPTLASAIAFAREYAVNGLREYPFDAIYKTTLDQIDLVKISMTADGGLKALPAESVTVGIMAAKELGNDEQDFAHALHVIQRYADLAMV